MRRVRLVFLNILNGVRGIPETDFQRDRAAILTVLSADDVIERMQDAGSIEEVRVVDRSRDVYLLATASCRLLVKFNRTCKLGDGLPSCTYSAEILLAESQGSCAK